MLKELQKQADETLKAIKAIQDKYIVKDGEKFVPYSAEDKKQIDLYGAEFDGLRDRIESDKKTAAAEAWAGTVEGTINQAAKTPKTESNVVKSWSEYVRDPFNPEVRASHLAVMKAHSAHAPGFGGAAVLPLEIAQEFVKLNQDSTFVRQLTRFLQVSSSESLGMVRIDDDGDYSWTTENGTATEANVTTDRRELKPHRLSKYVDLSRSLQRLSPNFAQELLNRCRYVVDRTEERAFLTGNGVGKPQGFMLEANLPSTQVNTTATADTVAYVDVVQTMELVKGQYRDGLIAVLGRNMESILRQLTDQTTGNPIWQPFGGGIGGGLREGFAPTILGVPYKLSEFAPGDSAGTANGSLTTDNISFAFANLTRGYVGADAVDIEIDVDMATQNLAYKVRYVVHKHTDAMIVDDGAFALMKIG